MKTEATGPETKDIIDRAYGNKVEPAIDYVGAWLVRGRYRKLIHDHNGFYIAINEASREQWESDSIVGLAICMGDVGLM